MPHLRVRGMKEIELVKISTELLDELVRIVNVPRDHFTIEYIPSTYIFDGEIDKNRYPFVEVLWFNRGEQVMKETANVITQYIKPFDYDDVIIYFSDLRKGHYYENGVHF
ncbi:MAG: DUF1904 domain-containing protein [Clostridiales bacterium]|nr:DUF1904 domain-containing protein [Clostridiales bacterium]